MDFRKPICKCNYCSKLLIDTIPNTNCIRYHEEDIPKRVRSLVEEGCPYCGSWDYLDDVFDELLVIANCVKEAIKVGGKQYPNAIFFKAITGGNEGRCALGKYLFLQ